jgi:ubiquitin C-terminal hydrolase
MAANLKIKRETGLFSSVFLAQEIMTKLCHGCDGFTANLTGCSEISVPITLKGGEKSVALETLLLRFFEEDHGKTSDQLECDTCEKVLGVLLF